MRGICHRCHGCGKRLWLDGGRECPDCRAARLAADALALWRGIRWPAAQDKEA